MTRFHPLTRSSFCHPQWPDDNDNLSNYSVINLLQANPELLSHVVLITDHGLPPMFFGGLAGITRRLFKTEQTKGSYGETPTGRPGLELLGAHRQMSSNYVASSSTVYSKQYDTQPIKLIELADHRAYQYIVRKEHGMDAPSQFQDIDIDDNTFIFIAFCKTNQEIGHNGGWTRSCVDLEHRLDQFTLAKWHVGARTFFTDRPEAAEGEVDETSVTGKFNEYGFPVRRPPVPLFQGLVLWNGSMLDSCSIMYSKLKTLRIEGICTLSQGLKLPQVRELSIVFKESLDGSGPRIWRLNAPLVRTFVVHYVGVLPVFDCCVVGYTPLKEELPLSAKWANHARVFEIADQTWIDHSQATRLSQTRGKTVVDHKTKVEKLDLSFLSSGFDVVFIGGGVPILAIDFENLANVRTLHWHIASPQDVWCAGNVLPLGSVGCFRAHISCDGVALPSLRRDDMYAPFCWISFLGLDGSIKTFLSSLGRSSGFDLYSSPRLCQSSGDLSKIISISQDEWWEHGVRCFRSTLELSLIGFKMDFLSCRVSTRDFEPSIVERRVRFCASTRLVLAPVIDLEAQNSGSSPEASPLNIHVDIFDIGGATHRTSINPIIVGANGVYPSSGRDVQLARPITLSMNAVYYQQAVPWSAMWTVGASRCFSSFILNGKHLSFEPDDLWKEELKEESPRRYHKRTRVESHRWEIPMGMWDPLRHGELCGFAKFNHISYNPFVKFPGDPMPYAAYHRNDYRCKFTD